MSGFAIWWRGRTPRERGLLLVMAALALVVALWLLVLRPLSLQLETARARHDAAVLALAEARARAANDQGTPAAAPPEGPVDAFIAGAANEAGFSGARVTGAGPDRATVAIESARSQALFAFAAEIERAGLAVERLTARANSDRTLAAEMTVAARRP